MPGVSRLSIPDVVETALKEAGVEIGLIGDVALDPYTSHGQDGLVEQGVVQNDSTVEVLCQQAVALASLKPHPLITTLAPD